MSYGTSKKYDTFNCTCHLKGKTDVYRDQCNSDCHTQKIVSFEPYSTAYLCYKELCEPLQASLHSKKLKIQVANGHEPRLTWKDELLDV